MAAEEKVVSNNSANHTDVSPSSRSEDSLRFLYGVSSREQAARAHALDNIVRTFDSWLEGYGSPKELVIGDVEIDDIHDTSRSTDFTHHIKEQLPDLLRLYLQCPFADVRDRSRNILQDLKVGMDHP